MAFFHYFCATMNQKQNLHPKAILFVCLGNICRSPMAEGVFKKIVADAGVEASFCIDSAGTAAYHVGELPDSRMRHHAQAHGYNLVSRARQVCIDDFERFDMLIAMDHHNFDALTNLAPSPEAKGRIYRMTDFCTQHPDDHVPDPYYGGHEGFEHVIRLLEDGCGNLFRELTNQ